MSLSELASNPLFREIAPNIHIDSADRIELKTVDLDPHTVEQALELTTSCCRCGRPVHVFRRRVDPDRRAPTTGAVFVSCSCPMDVSGCARSKAAKAAKAALIAIVRRIKSDAEWMAALLERV